MKIHDQATPSHLEPPKSAGSTLDAPPVPFALKYDESSLLDPIHWQSPTTADAAPGQSDPAAPQPEPAKESAVRRVTWQPIETAPKDGTWFLVIDQDSPMCWAPYGFCSWNTECSGRPEGFWCEEDVSEEIFPTHWMPLTPPASPEMPATPSAGRYRAALCELKRRTEYTLSFDDVEGVVRTEFEDQLEFIDAALRTNTPSAEPAQKLSEEDARLAEFDKMTAGFGRVEPAQSELETLKAALGNCYVMAVRQSRRTAREDKERWEHVKRFCESTGLKLKSDILRAQVPTEITDGAEPAQSNEMSAILAKKLDDRTRELSEAQRGISELQEHLHTSEVAKKSQGRVAVELFDELKETRRDLAAGNEIIQTLKGELATERDKLRASEVERGKDIAKLQSLRAVEIAQVQSDFEQMKEDRNRLFAERDAAQAELTRLKDEMRVMREENEKLIQQEELVGQAIPAEFEGSEETFGKMVEQIVGQRDDALVRVAKLEEALKYVDVVDGATRGCYPGNILVCDRMLSPWKQQRDAALQP